MAFLSVRRSALALVLALGAPLSALVAQATTGTVRGRVTDGPAGRGVSDAQVTVEGTRLGAISGANGDFTILAVPTGQRTIVVKRIGYSPATKAVAVTAEGISAGDIALTAS